MPDAPGESQGTGLAMYQKPSSCKDIDETGWVEVVCNVFLTEIQGLGRETGRLVAASEAYDYRQCFAHICVVGRRYIVMIAANSPISFKQIEYFTGRTTIWKWEMEPKKLIAPSTEGDLFSFMGSFLRRRATRARSVRGRVGTLNVPPLSVRSTVPMSHRCQRTRLPVNSYE
jgi:hypothetical protein